MFYVVLLGTLAVMMLRGVKLRLGETILLLFLLGWAFSQIRHQGWLVIVATMVLAPHLAGAASRRSPCFPTCAFGASGLAEHWRSSRSLRSFGCGSRSSRSIARRLPNNSSRTCPRR